MQRKLALGRDASGSADSDDGRTALGAAMQEANAILATPLVSPTSLATLVDKSEGILVAPGDCRGLMQLVANSFQWTTYRLGSAGFGLRQPVGPGTLFVGYGYRSKRNADPSFPWRRSSACCIAVQGMDRRWAVTLSIRGAIEGGTVVRFAAAIDQYLGKHARGFTADLTFSGLRAWTRSISRHTTTIAAVRPALRPRGAPPGVEHPPLLLHQ